MDPKTTIIVAGSLVASMPQEALPASAAVDALHLAAKLKTAFRSRLTTTAALESVQQWTDNHGLALSFDEDGFICIATNSDLGREFWRLIAAQNRMNHSLGRSWVIRHVVVPSSRRQENRTLIWWQSRRINGNSWVNTG